MMTSSKSLRRQVEFLKDYLVFADIALVGNPIVEIAQGGASRITWVSGEGQDFGDCFRGDFTNPAHYRRLVAKGAYMVLMYDGSLIQMTYDVRGARIIGHRLAYHPSPWLMDEDLLRTHPLLDVIGYYDSLDGVSLLRTRTALRFDYNALATGDNHPTCHLTLNASDCRLCVTAPLGPQRFIGFVFRHFYYPIWKVHPYLREGASDFGSRTSKHEEERLLHVTCRLD